MPIGTTDIAAYHATSTGKLISRFTNDVNRMSDALSRSLTAMVRDLLTAAAVIGVMWYLDGLRASIDVVRPVLEKVLV